MNKKDNKLVIERLTALWALNECGLGGFMHAFGTPFTGIFVGGISILFITIIASHTKTIFPTLLKALSIVLLVKLGVSPHSPITAYVAVSFQAFLGMILFRIFSINYATVVILGAVTFLESASQKLFTLTILYGQPLWDALEIYTTWVSGKLAFLNLTVSPQSLIVLFLVFYFFAGVLVGFFILRIVRLMNSIEVIEWNDVLINPSEIEKKSVQRYGKFFIFWMATIMIIMFPILFLSTEYGGYKAGIYIMARSLLVVILWYLVLGPLLLKGLNALLSKRKAAYISDIQGTLDLFPYLKTIIRYAWQDTSSLTGLNRIQYFLAKSIVYSIHFNLSKD